jgi:hypothetical protein
VPNSFHADEVTRRLDLIQKLTADLAKVQNDAIEQQHLADRISREILAAKQALKPTED